jgi:hypothetical protein
MRAHRIDEVIFDGPYPILYGVDIILYGLHLCLGIVISLLSVFEGANELVADLGREER